MAKTPDDPLAPFPAVLRELLAAELAAGNGILEISAGFPAPPVGSCAKLARPVTTRPQANGNGLSYRARNSSLYSGEFTDEKRFFFVLEPPLPPEPEPDMDAIREAANRQRPVVAAPLPVSATDRFSASMVIDYEKWHDGIGYDLALIHAATPDERREIEVLLLRRGAADWRDVEALAALGTPRAIEILRSALENGSHEVRLAVSRYSPDLLDPQTRTGSLVAALESAVIYGGLTRALMEVEDYHPPEIIAALHRGVLARDGETAVHFAAMLMFLHGRADSSFDMEQRPFFLRFNTDDADERKAVYQELLEKIGSSPA